jgi:hypothetical protein
VLIRLVYRFMVRMFGWPALHVPKISSAQAGEAIQVSAPHEVIALPWSRSLRHHGRLCCFDWYI